MCCVYSQQTGEILTKACYISPMGGPLILINRIQLVISMESLFLKSVQIIFIAEKPLSASDVDMEIIFNKLINGTKSAGID